MKIDMRRANQYLAVAARCGDPYAMAELGFNYEFGLGVPRSRQTALHWLTMAAPNWGEAQWAVEWLRRPKTPHFQNVDQLSKYINQQVAIYHGGRLPPASAKTHNCYFQPQSCAQSEQPDWYKQQQQKQK